MADKSTASLCVVPVGPIRRVQAPEGISPAQAKTWRAVVESKPPEWFGEDSVPMLLDYVRAVEASGHLETKVQAALASDGLGELKVLLEMRDKEAKRVRMFATSLRLTQQSRYTPLSAATANKKAGASKPWQVGAA